MYSLQNLGCSECSRNTKKPKAVTLQTWEIPPIRTSLQWFITVERGCSVSTINYYSQGHKQSSEVIKKRVSSKTCSAPPSSTACAHHCCPGPSWSPPSVHTRSWSWSRWKPHWRSPRQHPDAHSCCRSSEKHHVPHLLVRLSFSFLADWVLGWKKGSLNKEGCLFIPFLTHWHLLEAKGMPQQY